MIDNETEKELRAHNQIHILDRYNNSDDTKKQKMEVQIKNIDFEQIEKLYNSVGKSENFSNDIIESVQYVDKEKLSEDEYNKYYNIGAEQLKMEKCAVVTMAGGQGTRLGHTGPKGTFDIGLDSHKSIFEILADKLKVEYENYNVYVPWYIMTSEENNDQTVSFFDENNYFGYDKNKIKFFKQGKLPMVAEDGKILINEDGIIKEAADGNGGIYKSMKQNGIIDDMKKNNVEWIFTGPVDNVLIKMVDPIFLGVAIDKKVLIGGKSTVKRSPSEKVGVFCKKNGIPSVVEYIDIPEEMAVKTDEKGELLFGESHINCNLFNIKAIEIVANKEMPYHVAHKKAKYMDSAGQIINPEKPNAYKFESFIFDAFSYFDDIAVFRVKREDEFAPVKNAQGEDSPETARDLYYKYFNK